MIIYHGHPSKPSLRKCYKLAPSYTHGAEFSDKSGRRTYDYPYIIDNGAFSAWSNGESWDREAFVEFLEWAEKNERDPDFVVVPDVVGEAEATYFRSANWVNRIPFSTYQAVQDGMNIGEAIDFTERTGSDGIFIGGTKEWKRKTSRKWIEAAHESGLKAHIARPWDLKTAEELGADSVDTTTIVAWGAWHKLRALEEQTTLPCISTV